MEIGKRLAKLRKDHGYRQKEIAEYLNVAASTVSNYETGCHEPDLESLLKLADLFNVTTDYLLGRTDVATDINSLKKKLDPKTTFANLFEMMDGLTKGEKAYLIETIRLLHCRCKIEKKNRRR